MRVQSDLARKLKEYAGGKYKFECIYSFEWEAAERINTLESQLRGELDIKENMWKSLERVENQRDKLENENEFLRGLIRKYHLDRDLFTGKGNIADDKMV